MSEKINLDVLLPLAFELFKTVPGLAVQLKPETPEKRKELLTRQAEEFAAFTLALYTRLQEGIQHERVNPDPR
jgi:hypothetical protein